MNFVSVEFSSSPNLLSCYAAFQFSLCVEVFWYILKFSARYGETSEGVTTHTNIFRQILPRLPMYTF